MRAELRTVAASTTVVLHGELDLVTIERLRTLLDDACESECDNLVVDVADVPYADVLSLSAILAAADSVRERGGAASVRGATAPVRRVCSLLGADDVLLTELPRQRDR